MTRRFTVTTDCYGSCVFDNEARDSVAYWHGRIYSDHVERATAEADRLEAVHTPPPEWSERDGYVYRRGVDGWLLSVGSASVDHRIVAARVAELLNRHGLTDGAA